MTRHVVSMVDVGLDEMKCKSVGWVMPFCNICYLQNPLDIWHGGIARKLVYPGGYWQL